MSNREEAAFFHLQNVLAFLGDLTPGDTPMIIIDARRFWNTHNPDGWTLKPSGLGYTEVRHVMPGLDEDFDAKKMP
jgi:hypothetical protein